MDRILKEGRKYGVYFISKVHEVGTSDSIPDEARPSDTETLQQEENPSSNDNIVVDCESNGIRHVWRP